MDFLRSEIEFKDAARKVEFYLSTLKSTGAVQSAALIEILLPMAGIKKAEKLHSGSAKLAELISASPEIELTRSQIQQKLAWAFANRSYQSLRSSFNFPTEFRIIFPDAELPISSLEEGRTQAHPFPKKLFEFRELEHWRATWEAGAFSIRERPFFPPMLPASSFVGTAPHYELRRDWRPSFRNKPQHLSHHFSNGQCCVLVRHEGCLIAAVSWKWWGDVGRINGVGFSLSLKTDNRWLRVFFDIRPYYSDPSYGPIVYREGTGRDGEHIRACLQELVELPVHYFNDEYEMT
ncbi:hypothetical protein [Agrobacterium sp. NPDC089420]|uniref:hypothetical protein n=1 Tax=Agrobacterium sp. NPDC089420 TaxID=3363918 RepID=UPI00384ACA2F